ncbi:hypothetical protein Pelo_2266 [Pelomyxa schiedti]|nr:hypothetical protein Pelo_2266 [Pelomyxa schiedti]
MWLKCTHSPKIARSWARCLGAAGDVYALEDRATGHRFARQDKMSLHAATNGKWLVTCREATRDMSVLKLPRRKSLHHLGERSTEAAATIKDPTVVRVRARGWRIDVWVPEFLSMHEDYVLLRCYDRGQLQNYRFLWVDLVSTCGTKKMAVLRSFDIRMDDLPPSIVDFLPSSLFFFAVQKEEAISHVVMERNPLFSTPGSIDFITVEVRNDNDDNKVQPTFEVGTPPTRDEGCHISQLNSSQFCVFHANSDTYEVWDVRDAEKPVRTQRLLSGCTTKNAFVEGGLLFQLSESLHEIHVVEESSGDHVITFNLFRPISWVTVHTASDTTHAPEAAPRHTSEVSRAVSTSLVVWEWVLPWLVPGSLLASPDPCRRAPVKVKHAVALLGVAEAMYPLVGRACSSLLTHWEHWSMAAGLAATAGSPRCVSWLVRNRDRHRYGNMPETDDDGDDGDGDGGGEESSGMRMRRRRSRGNKAFACVLGGLCVGGHLGMAKGLVDPGDCGSGGGGGGVDWGGLAWQDGDGDCVVDNGLVDHVRASDMLTRVCEKGHMEVAKWIIERFSVRETWEFAGPLSAAVSGGHLALAQWMVATFDLVPKFGDCPWLDIHPDACKSENLEVVKWCLETFPVDKIRSYKILNACLSGKTSKCAELCQYVKERVPSLYPSTPSFYSICNLDVLKWAMHAFLVAAPTKDNVERMCAAPEGIPFCQWLVDERAFTLTAAMFSCACKNSKDNAQTAKWLSTRVPLSPEDICDAFVTALTHSNISIASWLDETFHILNPPNSSSLNLCSTSSSIFVKLCQNVQQYVPDVDGMEWFLNHSSMNGVDEAVISDCIQVVVKKPSFQVALFLMEHFHISEPKRSELLAHILKEGVRSDTISPIKKLVSMGAFSKESVAKCLANSVGLQSTKAARWLITHFHLEHQHITLDNNRMLFNVITWGQGSCAEWLINKFHITLDEFLNLKWEKDSLLWIDLFTWKTIQQAFPGLTAAMVKDRFLPLVCKSPVIAQVAMKGFPFLLTRDDILAFCSSTAHYHFSLSTRLWLRDYNPLIWARKTKPLGGNH